MILDGRRQHHPVEVHESAGCRPRFGHGLNPGFPDYLGTKVGFDACRPFPHTPEYDRAACDNVDPGRHEIDVPEIRGGPGTER